MMSTGRLARAGGLPATNRGDEPAIMLRLRVGERLTVFGDAAASEVTSSASVVGVDSMSKPMSGIDFDLRRGPTSPAGHMVVDPSSGQFHGAVAGRSLPIHETWSRFILIPLCGPSLFSISGNIQRT